PARPASADLTRCPLLREAATTFASDKPFGRPSVTASPTDGSSLRSRQFPNRVGPAGQWSHQTVSPALQEQHPPTRHPRASARSASLREGGPSPLVSDATPSRRRTLRQLRPPVSIL